MIAADVDQLERGAAELERALAIDDLVGNDDVAALECREPLLGAAMRDDNGARVLERLAAGDVIVVVVAVDQILDRRLGDLAERRRPWPPAAGRS